MSTSRVLARCIALTFLIISVTAYRQRYTKKVSKSNTIFRCPLQQEEPEGCAVIPRNPQPGQRVGIAAFSYDPANRNAPSRWPDLDCTNPPFDIFRMCAYCNNTCDGNSQSPIDIRFSDKEYHHGTDPPRISLARRALVEYEYAPDNYNLRCVNDDTCGQVWYQGRKFTFRQVHVHHTSEHYLDGQSFPLELHLVHASANGDLLVLGILYREGRFNSELQNFLNIAQRQCVGNLNLFRLGRRALRTRNLVTYSGSLTTPPCSEGVTWIVSTQPLEASIEQIRQKNQDAGGIDDERPLQPRNGRPIRSFGIPPWYPAYRGYW